MTEASQHDDLYDLGRFANKAAPAPATMPAQAPAPAPAVITADMRVDATDLVEPTTVVQVYFSNEEKRPTGKQPPFFQLIETSYPDFASFMDDVAEDRWISGNLLITGRGEVPQDRIVYNMTPTAFRGRVVERATLPTYHLIDGMDRE